jgi:hypothetical protein
MICVVFVAEKLFHWIITGAESEKEEALRRRIMSDNRTVQ